MTIIDECCYSMNLGCGRDVWAICGNVHNHPLFSPGQFIFTSTPVSYDINDDTFTTKSGRKYHIASYQGSKEKFAEQINKDIKSGYSKER